MTYLEKMGIDPTTKDGIKSLMDVVCTSIPDECGRIVAEKERCIHKEKSCLDCRAERLLRDVPTVKRWQLIKSDEDLMRFRKEFHLLCRSNACSECRLGYELDNSDDICFTRYLCEEVEE